MEEVRRRAGVYLNLFSAHPPFRIDGNLGLVAGMAKMLVDTRRGVLELLPALPPSWRRGSVRGVRGPRGVMIDLWWSEGTLTRARITGLQSPMTLRYGNLRRAIHAVPATGTIVDGALRDAPDIMRGESL